VPERLNGPVLKTGGRKSRGFESHPLRQALALAVLTPALILVCAGCSTLGPRSFTVTLPQTGDVAPLPVQLIDTTGSVTGLELPPVGEPLAPVQGSVQPVAGRSNAVVLEWTGGACDEKVEVELPAAQPTAFTLTTRHGLGGCFLVGVSRRVVIVFLTPVDPNEMTLTTVFEPIL
jgi:hypothetical protein